MHFKWENPCRIRHRMEKIKSLNKEHIFDEPKWNRIPAELENSLCILNGKNPCRIRHRIENIKSLDEEQIFGDPKWNRIKAEFENFPSYTF